MEVQLFDSELVFCGVFFCEKSKVYRASLENIHCFLDNTTTALEVTRSRRIARSLRKRCKISKSFATASVSCFVCGGVIGRGGPEQLLCLDGVNGAHGIARDLLSLAFQVFLFFPFPFLSSFPSGSGIAGILTL